jgi:carbon monoxide dehydrogenase subunit G
MDQKEYRGSVTVAAPTRVVLSSLLDIGTMVRLAPGVQRVLSVDTAARTARLLVKTNIGGINFEREVEVAVHPVQDGVRVKTTTYGLEFHAAIRVIPTTSGSQIEYMVQARSTSTAGAIVLRAVGQKVVEEFTDEFRRNLKDVLGAPGGSV